MEALGLIELFGVVPAIEALDAALKAAEVKRQSFTRVSGGLVTLTVTGEVSAVQAAMDAASTAAERVGQVLSVHVIPRPADGIEEILDEPRKPDTPDTIKKKSSAHPAAAEKSAAAEKKPELPSQAEEVGALSMAELEAMPVVRLRAAARDMGLDTLSRREIRDAKRDELLRAIRKFREREV